MTQSSVTMVELFAGVAYLITDILAVLSIVGSVIIVTTGVIERNANRCIILPDQILMWGFGGTILGFLGLLLIVSSEYATEPIGFVFRMSARSVLSLLMISLALLSIRTLIRRKVSAATAERETR